MNHSGHHEQIHGPHWPGEPDNQANYLEDDGSLYISAKALHITWGNDPRFWQWVALNKYESSELKFDKGAELIQVNWIEAKGNIDAHKLNPSTSYQVLYIIKFKDDAFGWHSSEITFEVTLPDGHKKRRTEVLENYRKESNVWHEIPCGEFSLPSSTEGKVQGKVAFVMHGDDSDWWKGGIILGGVTIKPH